MENDEVRSYLLDISYHGKNFNGFQSQLDGSGIQDHIEKSLGIYLREKIRIKGSSRTDSGVHAFGQKALFKTTRVIEEKKFLLGVNSILPREIGLRGITEVPKDFDPIFLAKAKVYRYTLHLGRCFNPFLFDYIWSVPRNLDLDLLQSSLKNLEGQHDFTSFCNTDTNVKTKIRRILETKVIQFEDSIDIWFLGEGFLKQMIRIIVGTLVDLSLDKIQDKTILQILNEKDRKKSGQTAPASGLSLVEVFFENPPKLADFVEKQQKKSFLYR